MRISLRILTYISLALYVCQSKRFLITRHGQRSPTKVIHTNTSSTMSILLLGGISTNQVTQLNQVHSIWKEKGNIYLCLSTYVNSYLYQKDDQDGNCDLSRIQIISSVKERTILSTLAYLKGICQKNYLEISREYILIYLKQFATNTEDFEKLIQNDQQDIIYLSNYTRSFINKNDHMFHGSSDKICPAVKSENDKIKLSEIYRKTDLYFRQQESFRSVLQHVIQQNQEDFIVNPNDYTVENYGLKEMKSFYSAYHCDVSQGLEVPLLTDEQKVLLNQISEFILYFTKYSTEIQLKASLSESFRWVLDSLNKPLIELHWYSAHDFNIASVLAVFISPLDLEKLDDISIPPFGSDIHIVVEDDQVNVFYINTPLKTLFCLKGYDCSLHDFTNYLSQYIVDDIKVFCKDE